MINLRKKCRLNRILVLAIALLISNVAVLSCAMAYALCADESTACPEHPAVICEDPCAQSDIQIADTSSDGFAENFHPFVVLTGPAVGASGGTDTNGLIAKDDPSCDLPALPLRLRFCVFLN